MPRLRLTLAVALAGALIAPASGLAALDSAAAPAAARTVGVPLPSAGDVTFAEITITAPKRLAKNPKLSVANAAALPAEARVFASMRPLNRTRTRFEALVIVAVPAAAETAPRATQLAPAEVDVRIEAFSRRIRISTMRYENIFGYGIAEEVCSEVAFVAAMALLAGEDIADIEEALFGKSLCEWGTAVPFVLPDLSARVRVGADHIGPGRSETIGAFTTWPEALVTVSSPDLAAPFAYRALRVFGEDFAVSESTGCVRVPIMTFGSHSITWTTSAYGLTATATGSLSVGPAEVALPECQASGDITSYEPFGCFGSTGRGYVGWELHGTPGTTFHLEMKGTSGMFYETDTATVTGTIPASGELYTGVSAASRGLIDVRIVDTAPVTLTVDTTEELPAAPEEAEPVCDVM